MFDFDKDFLYDETDDAPSGDAFTGIYVTGQSDASTVLVQVYENGQLEDTSFVDSDSESIEEALVDATNQLNSDLDRDDDDEDYEKPDILVDSRISEKFEDNLAKFPYEPEDVDDDDDLSFISPEERARIEADLEDAAEDAFTRYLDNSLD